MMFGFYGKLLKIDLDTKDYATEDIPSAVLASYLGGKGLGTYLLLKHVPSGTDPLSPENKLIFATGNATGSKMLGNSRYGVFTRSPLTGLYTESYAGGKVAPILKKTGYDAIILEGKSKQPVYLEISDERVTFHDATHLWGMDAYSTEDSVLKEVGVSGSQAVVIGPAGENQVHFANIENNHWRTAGRTGAGAVMGSKNLKAMVFYGQQKAEIAHPEMLDDYLRQLRGQMKDNPGVNNYRKLGTTQMVAIMNNAGAFPARYWTKNRYEKWNDISGEMMLKTHSVKSQACPQCTMACGKLTKVTSGRHVGLQIEGPEYETIYAFGGLCCIPHLDEIIYLNDICDRQGIDTITAGNLVGLVMEAHARGMLDYPLNYGDAEGAARLLHKIVNKEGIGETLAKGIKTAAQELGLQDLAIHVKGLEPPGYDPRVLKGVGLGYATSARGACHLRATFYKPELAGFIDKATTEGKAKLYTEYEDRLTIFNTQIICVFFRDLIQWPDLATLVEATTGMRKTEAEFKEIANNIIGLTRLFNYNNGAGPQDDRLPQRFYKEPHQDVESNLSEEDLEIMLADYYSIRGWDSEGSPVGQKHLLWRTLR